MIKIMPDQIWSEGSPNHNHHFGYWKVLEVVSESEEETSINMQVAYRNNDGTYQDGENYTGNPWTITDSMVEDGSWKLVAQAGPVERHTTVFCINGHGAFVLSPGQEWTNKCPDCESSTQATIA